MTFLNPLFLWALFTVLIPPLIHLFNFRRYKKVYFTNVRFLKQVEQESKSRSKLRELLVLLFRCLALAALVLAFSQPVIRKDEQFYGNGEAKRISLYIDNSFSMQNVGRNGPLFDEAVQKAREIVKAFGPQDRFQILSNELAGKQQRLLNKEEALEAINDIRINPRPRLLSQVIARQEEALSPETPGSRLSFIISDGQKSSFDLGQIKRNDSFPVSLLHLPSNRVNNIYIDTCWLQSLVLQAAQKLAFYAKVINAGEEKLEQGAARLFLDGRQVAISSFSLNPGASQILKLDFKSGVKGFHYGNLRIEDYPVTFDDEYYFAYSPEEMIRVYVINSSKDLNAAPATLFQSDSLFHTRVSNETQINYALFRNCDFLVLNGLSEISSGLLSELERYTREGGTLLIIPPDGENPAGYPNLLRSLGLPGFVSYDTVPSRVEDLDIRSDFFEGVFLKQDESLNLPQVKRHHNLSGKTPGFEPLLKLLNGDTWLGQAKTSGGTLYLFSSSLNEANGNMVKHALFVPTFYRMAFRAIRLQPLSHRVSRNNMILFRSDSSLAESPPRIVRLDNKAEVIPEYKRMANQQFVFCREQVTEPGFYVLKQNNEEVLPLAFNNDRLESVLDAYTSEELGEWTGKVKPMNLRMLDASSADLHEQVTQGAEPFRVWKLFLLLALAFMLAEILVLRLLN